MKIAPSSTLRIEPFLALFLLLFIGCKEVSQVENTAPTTPFLMVLGVAQDAGYPQAGYQEEWKAIDLGQRKPLYTVSLGLIDPANKKRYLFDATPDFKEQLQMLDEVSESNNYPMDGIFLTHAHIGHYTGLMHLGREVMSAKEIPVHAMPRMKSFLEENGPWSQLVSLNNISIKSLQDSSVVTLSDELSVMPFIVPHRDEYSETVGYKIEIMKKSVIFIPDIDKWDKWDIDIREVVKNNDIILIDASFYRDGELEGRDMSLIPHPFTEESMKLFEELTEADKGKVHFIHANHTNPILDINSEEYDEVTQGGFHVAEQGQILQF